jgi:hypothetical protein
MVINESNRIKTTISGGLWSVSGGPFFCQRLIIQLIINKVTKAANFLTLIYYTNWRRAGDIFLNFISNHPYSFPADA